MTLPAPLTPADADLQDFPFMPLQVARLRDSDLAAEADPEACWYAVLLWSAAWHQTPAGSLPDNEAILTRLCNLGRDLKTFRKHRAGAMRGFVLCNDGRWYHPVVAEQVKEAWRRKLEQRWRTECARIKKANQRSGANDPTPTLDEFLNGLSPGTSPRTSPGTPPPCPDPVPRDMAECPPGQSLQETGTGTETLEESFALTSSPAEQARRAVATAEVQAAFDGWNALAQRLGLPVAKTLSPDRRRRLNARLQSDGLAEWQAALRAIEGSEFCRGGGGRGWRIDLDALLQPRTWTRLIEGSYGAPVGGVADPSGWDDDRWRALIELWRDGADWPVQAGPPPDEPGTRVPRHLLIGMAPSPAQPELRTA